MEGRTLLSLLHGLPKGLKNGVKDSEALGGAVIACAVKAVSVGLEAERKEHVRSYTSARQVVALGTFATAVTQVVALAHKWPLLLPVAGGLRNKPLRDKLTAELTAALEPALGEALPKPLPPPAPADGDAPAPSARASKRSSATVALPRNSPSSKRQEGIESSASTDRSASRTNNLSAQFNSVNLADSPVCGLTPMAEAQIASNLARMTTLTDENASLRIRLAAAEFERDAERTKSAELQSKLDAVTEELKTVKELCQEKDTAMKIAQGAVLAAKETANDMRHSQSLWSSLLMAKDNVNSTAFATFMQAQQKPSQSETTGEQ